MQGFHGDFLIILEYLDLSCKSVPDTYLIYAANLSNASGLFPPKDYCLDQVANAAKLVWKKTREAKFFGRASGSRQESNQCDFLH